MDELIKIIIGVSGTVIGGILGYFIRIFIENRLAIDRMRENIRITEFNKASAKLRAAFAPAQVQIRQPRIIGNSEARVFFENAITAHAIAVEEFRPFACGNSSYQKAWDEYEKTVCGYDDMGDAEFKWQTGMVTYAGDKENRDIFKEINEKIEKILHFATPIK